MKPAAPAFVFLVITLAAGQTHADAWVFQPVFRVEQSYDDNVGLRENTIEGSASTRLTGSANIRHSTDRATTRANVTVNLKEYWNDVFESDNNYNFTLDSGVRGERSQFGVRGWIIRDNSISTRRIITDPIEDGLNPDDDPDEGLTQSKVKRWRFNVRPSWSYAFDELTSTRFRVTYSKVDYEDNDQGLRDYDVIALVGSVQRNLTERTSLAFNTEVGRFETDDGDNETKNLSITGDLRHQFSETFQGTLRLGWRFTDIDTPSDNGSDDGRVAGLILTKRTEVGQLRAQLTQDLIPSGRGDVRKQERLVLEYRQSLDPRWNLSLRGQAFRVKNLDSGDSDSSDRKFLAFEPRISWNVTEWWSLGASYRYQWIDRDSDDDTTDSHAVFVNLTYTQPVPLF